MAWWSLPLAMLFDKVYNNDVLPPFKKKDHSIM